MGRSGYGLWELRGQSGRRAVQHRLWPGAAASHPDPGILEGTEWQGRSNRSGSTWKERPQPREKPGVDVLDPALLQPAHLLSCLRPTRRPRLSTTNYREPQPLSRTPVCPGKHLGNSCFLLFQKPFPQGPQDKKVPCLTPNKSLGASIRVQEIKKNNKNPKPKAHNDQCLPHTRWGRTLHGVLNFQAAVD
jgi:hypothetical protein